MNKVLKNLHQNGILILINQLSLRNVTPKMSIEIIKIAGTNVTIDLEDDHYGKDFWVKIELRKYEPDTINFIEENCNSNVDFIDIGAANGAFTVLSALNNARTLSIEPDPKMSKICAKNLSLNPNVSKFVTVENFAVSTKTSEILFSKKQNSKILSDIVFTGHDKYTNITIQTKSLPEIISDFHQDKNRGLVIKMDIEGAEWEILRDKISLTNLKENKALMLLATHPGFYRPFERRIKGIDYFRYKFWKYRNYRESKHTFESVSKFAVIARTNLDIIHDGKIFGNLTRAGYNEFVVDFR
jgi:FkbM family methyltransferase